MLAFAATRFVARACWVQVTDSTLLAARMVLIWSLASHVARASRHDGVFVESGMPRRKLSEGDLEEMIPIELLWDVVLPLFGLSIGVCGVQFTLSLTMLEPLLLLLVPWMQDALRSFHDRLLAWHLGGLFGSAMIVAQVVISRSEKRYIKHGITGFGILILAYIAGAVFGSALRRAIELSNTSVTTQRIFQGCIVLGLVLGNLASILRNGALLSSGEHEETNEHEALLPAHPREDGLTPSAGASWPQFHGDRPALSHQQLAGTESIHSLTDRLYHIFAEIVGTLHTAWQCADMLMARGLILFGLSAIIGPAPLASVDVFEGTPLGHGFSVLWFDIAGVLASGLLAPLAIGRSWCSTGAGVLNLSFSTAVMSCLLAMAFSAHAHPSAFAMAMLAGVALSVCAALASLVLSVYMLELVSSRSAGVALGWGMLMGGIGELLGSEVGNAAYLRFSWLGSALIAGISCGLAWWASQRVLLRHDEKAASSEC